MTTTNVYFLHEFISPFVGGADDDEMCLRFQRLDMDDATIARQIIEQEIVPHFHTLGPAMQKHSKETLAYYLSTNRLDFARVLYSALCPFEVNDARAFFQLIWEILFAGEQPTAFHSGQVIERNNLGHYWKVYLQDRKQHGLRR